MKTTYITYIGLLLLSVLLLPTGCTKNEEDEDDILTNKPGENGIVRLSKDATILLSQKDLVDLVPDESVYFYLLPCNDKKHVSTTSGPYLQIEAEKDDDGNFNLYFPAGTECIPYLIIRSTDQNGHEPQNLGLKVILSDDGTLYTDDTYDYTYKLFGQGTAEAPYRVCQLRDLKSINLVRNNENPVTHAGKYFRQEVNILCGDDLNRKTNTEEGGIQPIGMVDISGNKVITPFCGNFNGNGLFFSDMSLRSSGMTDNLGIFAEISDGAEISNMVVNNLVVSSANQNIGGLAGIMKGNAVVKNCHVNVNLAGCKAVGGLIGRMEGGQISNCVTTGEVKTTSTATGLTYGFGGIVGYMASDKPILIEEVENGAAVDGTENVGGIVGYIAETGAIHTLSNVRSTSNNITGLRSVGGLVGGSSNGLILTDCKSSTRISPRAGNEVKKDFGGLIGAVSTNSSLKLTNCTTTEPILGETSVVSGFHVGGLVGYVGAQGGATFENCKSGFSVGVTLVPDDNKGKFIGGLVGRSSTVITFTNCECTAKLVQSGLDKTLVGSYVGGIIGRCDAKVTITNCTNKAEIKAITCAGGLVGNTEDVDITNSTNQANVEATESYAGGLIGFAARCMVKDVTIQNEAKGNGMAVIKSPYHAGGIAGLIGEYGGTIDDCIIGGHINEPGSSNNSKAAGGIIGEVAPPSGTPLTVSNVTFKGSVASGLFTGGLVGYTYKAYFNNCTVESTDGKILATKDGKAGGIAGYATNAIFNNCTNNTLVAVAQGTNENIGGIIGYNLNCILRSCTNTADVQAPSQNFIGGICGYARYTNDNTYEGCTNSGSVVGGNQVGGINGIFFSRKSTLISAKNKGAVGGGEDVGGVNGFQSGGTVLFASNRGQVNGNKKVGGINGKMNGTSGDDPNSGTTYIPVVDRSFNIGNIDGNSYVGGISGTFEYYSYARVANSYNRGRVGHNGTGQCAGIVGNVYNTAQAKIESCYSGTAERTGYGVVGHCLSNAQSEVAVYDTYYLANNATSGDDHGFSKKVSQLYNQGSFRFDFKSVWRMVDGYPQLEKNLENLE